MSMYREFMLNCLTWEDQTRLKTLLHVTDLIPDIAIFL